VEVNGTVPATPIELLDAVRTAVPGAPIAVTYWRGGEEHRLELIPRFFTRPPAESKQVA
jgi:S1-C subfamily serine protease